LPKSSPAGSAVTSAAAGRGLPNAPFREVPGNLLERFYCSFASGKGNGGGIKWPLLWQHPQLPNSRLMPSAPNRQTLKLLPYFKLLSRYVGKTRQSLLSAAMPSLRGVSAFGETCGEEGTGAVLSGAGRGRTNPSSAVSVRKSTGVFHSCAALVQTFCKQEGQTIGFFVGILAKRFRKCGCPLKTSVEVPNPG